MAKQLSRGAARFKSILVDLGHEHKVEQFIGSAKTAEEAAAIIGYEPEQIAKTTVYQLGNAKEALIVVMSGL